MTKAEYASLREKLDAFARRLDAKTREFHEQGEFADVHEMFVKPIREHHDQMRKKVESAIRNGTAWDQIKAEFSRDFDGLNAEFGRLEERLDAEIMKKGGR